MNNNLVPELRADVNGKLVTRHVNPGNTGAGSLKPVPAPVLKMEQRDAREALIAEVTPHLKNSIKQADFASYIRGLPANYADALYEGMQATGDAGLIDRITLRANQIGAGTLMGLSAAFMKDVTDAFETVKDNPGNSGASESNTIKIFNQVYEDNFNKPKKVPDDYDYKKHLPAYQAAVVIQILGCTEGALSNFEIREQHAAAEENLESLKRNIKPLTVCTEAMWQVNRYADTHQLIELSQILDEYPGTDELICGYVQQRERLDLNEIRSIVEGGAVPLASGML